MGIENCVAKDGFRAIVNKTTYLAVLIVTFAVLSACSVEEPPQHSNNDQANLVEEEQATLKDSKPKSQVLYGIDVSHYQGNLLNEISDTSRLNFVICKATQGSSYVDPKFQENWASITKQGWVKGAYHFYVYGVDPEKQASHFHSVVSSLGENDIPPIVDAELLSLNNQKVAVKDLQQDLMNTLDAVEKKFARKPLIYTSYAFAQEYLTDTEFAEYDLWLAEYSGKAKPILPDTWKQKGFRIWQRSDSHKINSQDTDFDVHYGDVRSLVK